MPDPVEALQAVAAVVRPGGRIYVTQTYQKRAAPVMRVVKGRRTSSGAVTTVDFGKLTSCEAAERIFRDSEKRHGTRRARAHRRLGGHGVPEMRSGRC